eukprot:NODE_104_length_19294_cov_0.449179.p6 type:complete len:366 gc:universal NODE_104_length_19294_cov_0.449179:3242-2145(-)
MKKHISLLFGITLVWILIILNQYASENISINKSERSFVQTHCNGTGAAKEGAHKEARVTVTTTKIVVKTECPEASKEKEPEQKCHIEECRAKAGNCKNNKCEWDSGWRLEVDEFKPPEIGTYTWEKSDLTHEKLMNYPADSIPPIFHQSWKNVDVPDRYLEWEKSCMNFHKHWDHLLWTDKDNRQLIASEYPWLLYTYDRLNSGIMRADFVRYVYLHHFGGIYADLDVECLKPSDELVKDRVVILGVLGDDYNFIHNIPNAILASQRGHPFWLFLLNRITMLVHQNGGTEEMTGPIILRDSYLLFLKYEKYKKDFYVASSSLLYGVDWHNPPANCVAAFGQHLDTIACKKLFPDAFMITYWTHSW